MPSGGYRPGAGRPRKVDKNKGAINKAEKQIRDKLPEIVEALIKEALGGYKRVDEEWQPAGLVTIGCGEREMPAFPGKEYGELVLVKRKVSVAAPNMTAVVNALDRIMGKPLQRVKDEDAPEKISAIAGLIQEMQINRGIDLDDGEPSRAGTDKENSE